MLWSVRMRMLATGNIVEFTITTDGKCVAVKKQYTDTDTGAQAEAEAAARRLVDIKNTQCH